MTNEEAVKELNELLLMIGRAKASLNRKRSMRPSEKVMSGIAYDRMVEAVRFAITKFERRAA